MLQYGQRLSTGCVNPGSSWKIQAKVSPACVLPGATQHELQSDLQMAATCAGLGGAQVKPSCEPRPATASARPGAT